MPNGSQPRVGGMGALLLLLLSVFPAHAAQKVWAEYPLAAVQSGISEVGGTARFHVVSMGFVAPSSIFEPTLKGCTQQAVDSAGVQLREKLASAPGIDTIVSELALAGSEVSLETLTNQKSKRIQGISKLLVDAGTTMKVALATCIGPAKAQEINLLVSVGYVLRECTAAIAICQWSSSSKLTPRNYPSVFERFYSWAAATQRRPVNEWVGVDGAGLPINLNSAGWERSIIWPDPTPMQAALSDLERLVNYARRHPSIQISYAVPAIAGAHKETALRIVDELRDPFTAMEFLPTGADALSLVSDELGRNRLIDCARLQGKNNTQDIGTCAGFSTTATEIYACVQGQRCLPQLKAEALAGLLTMKTPLDLQGLIKNTQLPRVGINIPYPEWAEKARRCNAAPTKEQSVACLLKETMASEDYAMVECVKKASGNAKSQTLLDCAEQLAGGDGKTLMQCMRSGEGDPQATAYCAAAAAIPVNLQPAIKCLRESTTTSAAAACLAASALGENERRIYGCYVANPKSTQAAVLCAVAQDLPADARMTIACAQKSGGDWRSMAACVAADQLKLEGDFGRIVSCGLSSGGSYVGAAACAAGSSLRPEQAIILQCAATASTGPGFLVCAGGMLAFNEYTQCKDTRVGKDNCFGENNEIRRFVRALGLPDIGPNSLAAQVGNVYLDIINVQVAYLEGIAKGGKVLVREVARIFEQAGAVVKKAVKEAENFGKNVHRCVTKPWKC